MMFIKNNLSTPKGRDTVFFGIWFGYILLSPNPTLCLTFTRLHLWEFIRYVIFGGVLWNWFTQQNLGKVLAKIRTSWGYFIWIIEDNNPEIKYKIILHSIWLGVLVSPWSHHIYNNDWTSFFIYMMWNYSHGIYWSMG